MMPDHYRLSPDQPQIAPLHRYHKLLGDKSSEDEMCSC